MILLAGGIEITGQEEACFLNDLMDIEEWVRAAVEGKIANCRARLVEEWRARLAADGAGQMVPADDESFIAMVLAHPEYENRVARELKAARA